VEAIWEVIKREGFEGDKRKDLCSSSVSFRANLRKGRAYQRYVHYHVECERRKGDVLLSYELSKDVSQLLFCLEQSPQQQEQLYRPRRQVEACCRVRESVEEYR